MTRTRWWILLLSAAAVAVYFPTQYVNGDLSALKESGVGLAGYYSDRSSFIKLTFYVHILTAGVALLLGGVQFSTRLRSRHNNLHRRLGLIYTVSALVGAASAFVLSFVSSLAFVGFFGFGSLAVLWFWTTICGYRSIASRLIADHHAWQMRSFALTYAAVTLRLWIALLTGFQELLGVDGDIVGNAYAPTPFLCWLPNIAIAEWMIRRRNLPGLRFVSASGERC